METLEKIKIKDIKVPKHNVRVTNIDRRLEDLKASIRSLGLIEPIIVYKDESGQYVAIVGQRRLLAYNQLNEECPDGGFDEIKCILRDPPEGSEMRKATSMAENVTHVPMSNDDLRHAVTELYNACGSYRIVEERFGLTRYMVDKYVGLSRLPDNVKDAIRAGELHNDQRSAERIALEAVDGLQYSKGGDVSEAKVLELAREIAKRREIKNAIVREAKKNPARPVDDIIKRAESRTQVDLHLVMSSDMNSRLETYVIRENYGDKETALVDIISEWLDSEEAGNGIQSHAY